MSSSYLLHLYILLGSLRDAAYPVFPVKKWQASWFKVLSQESVMLWIYLLITQLLIFRLEKSIPNYDHKGNRSILDFVEELEKIV